MSPLLLLTALMWIAFTSVMGLAHPQLRPRGGSSDSAYPPAGQDQAVVLAPISSGRDVQGQHRQLEKFMPQDYSEFAHLAEYLTGKLGDANAEAEEKAELEEKENERARMNGLAFSQASSDDGQAEARRKALRAYGVGSEEADTPTVTTTAPTTSPPPPAVESLLASIEW